VARGQGLNRQNSAGATVRALLVDTGDIGGFAESVDAREHLELDGYADTALKAAALEHKAAGPGGHAGNKPVYALAAALLWLVRSLRHNV
jgi:hypothetical protein